MVVTEEQRGQHREIEKARWQTDELVEGEIQVHQMKKGGNRCWQSGEEARQRLTL